MLAKVIQRMKEWEGLSPDLFRKLVAEIEGRAQCADSTSLLKKLAQIEKDERQRILVGQLKDAFGEGPIHEVLSREKDDRATNYTKTVRNLRSAAQSLDLLAAIDSASEATFRLELGAAGSEPWRTMIEQKSSLAVALREHASTLEAERETFRRGYSLRRLGARSIHGNAESLSMLLESFDLSDKELALLVWAALRAWKQRGKDDKDDVEPRSLGRNIARFRKRVLTSPGPPINRSDNPS